MRWERSNLGCHFRVLGAAMAMLAALPARGLASTPLLDALNAIRTGGCGGRSGVVIRLRASDALDAAAERLARGTPLEEALAAARYHATDAASLHVGNVVDVAEAAAVLRRGSCAELLNPAFRDVGTVRSGSSLWIVLAAPFAAPALSDAAAVRRRVLELTNAARAEGRRCGGRRLAPAASLAAAPALDRAALEHARDMARHERVAHEGSDGSTPSQRVAHAGYRWRFVGENVAAGPLTPEAVVRGWLGSPGHCANLMDPRFVDMGIGVVVDADTDGGVYWTQLFGAPGR